MQGRICLGEARVMGVWKGGFAPFQGAEKYSPVRMG